MKYLFLKMSPFPHQLVSRPDDTSTCTGEVLDKQRQPSFVFSTFEFLMLTIKSHRDLYFYTELIIIT